MTTRPRNVPPPSYFMARFRVTKRSGGMVTWCTTEASSASRIWRRKPSGAATKLAGVTPGRVTVAEMSTSSPTSVRCRRVPPLQSAAAATRAVAATIATRSHPSIERERIPGGLITSAPAAIQKNPPHPTAPCSAAWRPASRRSRRPCPADLGAPRRRRHLVHRQVERLDRACEHDAVVLVRTRHRHVLVEHVLEHTGGRAVERVAPAPAAAVVVRDRLARPVRDHPRR